MAKPKGEQKMRIKSYGRGLAFVLLVFTLVLLLTSIAMPVLTSEVISHPGGSTVEVDPGENFTLRHKLAWDDAANPGYYLIAIYWDHFGDNAWDFTLESAIAYFDNGDPIDATVSTADNGTRRSIAVSNAVGNDNDGIFNVDITLRASGPDGTPHMGADNHPIYYTILQSLESVPPAAVTPAPVTVRVPGWGVAVAISPSYQSNLPEATLEYTVTITNVGTFDDTYDLTISDSENWGAATSLASLTISAGGEGTATLNVTIPLGASIGTEGKITVTATSRGNAEIRASNTCTARASAAIVRGVEVSISPSYQSGSPGTTLHHTVNVQNLGSIEDTFTFEVTSDADWSTSIEPTSLTLAAGGMGEATLSVVVPPDASENSSMTVVVKATSTGDPTVSNSGTCEAVVSGKTPTAWPAALVVLIVVIILAGGFALYSIFKRGQQKRKNEAYFQNLGDIFTLALMQIPAFSFCASNL